MSRVNKQSVLLFIGNPSTGKTTSTQRVYYQFLNNYVVSLLTTLSIRVDQETINDLYSEEYREQVYQKIAELTENRLRKNDDFVILDGNFNKRHRRQAIYEVAQKKNSEIFVVECLVTQEDSIKDRLEYRQRHENNIQHKASSMELYRLIKDDADLVYQDVLPSGKKPTIIQYYTDTQTMSLVSETLESDQRSIVGQIKKAILPESSLKEIMVETPNPEVSRSSIKAIVFDVGGVIQQLRWEKVANKLAKLKPGLTTDEFRNAFYYDKEQYFGLYETSKLTAIEFWTMVADQIGLSSKNLGALSESIALLYSDIDDEIVDLISTLHRNYSLYILSNSFLELERQVQLDKSVYQNFDKVYFSHKIGFKKPSLDSYRFVLNDIELEGNECIFIDDVSDNIRAAEEVGMHGILFVSVQALLKKLQNYISF